MKRVSLITAFRDKLLLMGKRNDTGKMTLPGGKLEGDEDPKAGAIRELFEETGLEPDGELTLVDERTLGETQIYTFECKVTGAPHSKNDPDNECSHWVFIDISEGIPKAIADHMQGPTDPKKNITSDLFGIKKAMLHFGEELAKMAIANLPAGQQIDEDTNSDPSLGPDKTYDYSHVLKPEHIKQGYSLHVIQRPRRDPMRPEFKAQLMHKGDLISAAVGYRRADKISMEPHVFADMVKKHRGKGLGVAMYEGLFRHAQLHGIKQIMGQEHSDAAARVHASLARRHGMDYKQERLPDPDEAYPNAPYTYAIKGEMPMTKADSQVQQFSLADAQAAHKQQWHEGKHKGTLGRYTPLLTQPGDEEQGYVQAHIPVGDLNSSAANPDRVNEYIKIMQSQGTMGPSWGKFSGQARGQGKVYLHDGNHRATAAMALGHTHVPVMMPKMDYDRYVGSKQLAKADEGLFPGAKVPRKPRKVKTPMGMVDAAPAKPVQTANSRGYFTPMWYKPHDGTTAIPVGSKIIGMTPHTEPGLNILHTEDGRHLVTKEPIKLIQQRMANLQPEDQVEKILKKSLGSAPRGFVSPEGKFHTVSPDEDHHDWIGRHVGMPDEGDYAYGKAMQQGWMGVGVGGAHNVNAHSSFLSQPEHPATKAVRNIAKRHWGKTFEAFGDKSPQTFDTASFAHQGKLLSPSPFRKSDVAVAKKPKVEKKNANLVPDEPNLVVTHNLSPEGLVHAHKLGGLAAPSLAVSHKDAPLEGFGNISLVGHHDMVNPQLGVPVFASDVYSPRQPRAKMKVNNKEVGKFHKWYAPHADAVGTYHSDLDGELERDGMSIFQNSGHKTAMGHAYLASKGIKLSPEADTHTHKHAFANSSEVQDFFKQHGVNQNFSHGDEYHQGLSQAASKGVHSLWKDTDPDDPELEKEMIADDHEKHFGKGLLRQYTADRILGDQAKLGQKSVNSGAWRDAVDNELTKPEHSDFEDFVKDKTAPLHGGDYLHTSTGKKIPYNIDNVMKEMTKKIRQGESFNYGLGTARAAGTKRFKTLQEMQKMRSKIVPKAEFEKAREDMDLKFHSLAQSLLPYNVHGQGFGGVKDISEAIGNSYKKGRSLASELHWMGFKAVPPHVLDAAHRFSKDLLNMPTEYFEAKPQRAVGLHEFKGAAIPHDSHPRIADILKQNGIDHIEHYDRNKPGDRKDAINRIAAAKKLHLNEIPMAKMAIADIPAGQKVSSSTNRGRNVDVYDYSHVLSPEHVKQGYSLTVHHAPMNKPLIASLRPEEAQPWQTIEAKLHHNGNDVGEVQASNYGLGLHGPIEPHAHIRGEHKGKGLGTALYEAAYKHASLSGIKHVCGGEHTLAASRVHQKLAAKHGLEYTPVRNGAPDDGEGEGLGDHEPYSYAIKSELPPAPVKKTELAKSEQNPFRGFISPTGVFHETNGNEDHKQLIKRHFNLTTDPGYLAGEDNALSANEKAEEKMEQLPHEGWLAIGTSGARHITGLHSVLSDPNHPATKTAMNMAKKHWLSTPNKTFTVYHHDKDMSADNGFRDTAAFAHQGRLAPPNPFRKSAPQSSPTGKR